MKKTTVDKNISGRGQRDLKVKVKSARGKTVSQVKWLQRQLNDPYVKRAQLEGFRGRAAFKILELNEKFNFLLPGSKVVDLGCAPGGWLQVISEIVNKENKGKIIGVDLLETDTLPDVEILVGNINDQIIIDKIGRLLEGSKVNGVVSDMAADTTGHRPTDHIRTTMLLEEAMEISIEILKEGGFFLGKCFKGGAEANVLKKLNSSFKVVKHVKPDASRKESVESYVLGMGFKG